MRKETPNEVLETVIGLIENIVKENGFKTLRFSETENLGTTEYDCLVIKDQNGKEYTIGFKESMTPRQRGNGELNFNSWESTNYIKDCFSHTEGEYE